MASLCPDQNSIGISTVAVEVFLQKGDLEKAIGLTGELFPFTDDVMSSDTHSVSVHLVAEALRKGLVSLLLEQAFTTRHHNKFFVGVIHECALLGNRAVCERSKSWWALITFYQGHVPHSSERMEPSTTVNVFSPLHVRLLQSFQSSFQQWWT